MEDVRLGGGGLNRYHANLIWALDTELVRRGLEIPFPQRDLHIRSGTLDVRVQRPGSPDEPTDQASAK